MEPSRLQDRSLAVSFIPPADIAAIRELCRYRRTLIEERTREGQRLRKVLEDGGIKLDSDSSREEPPSCGQPNQRSQAD